MHGELYSSPGSEFHEEEMEKLFDNGEWHRQFIVEKNSCFWRWNS